MACICMCSLRFFFYETINVSVSHLKEKKEVSLKNGNFESRNAGCFHSCEQNT